ncbi:uncharacterized protein ACOB8E_006697 [Sarcophilus harrisii]
MAAVSGANRMETSHHTPFQSFVAALKQHRRDMWKNLVNIFNPMLAKSHIKSFLRGTDQEGKPTGKNEEKKGREMDHMIIQTVDSVLVNGLMSVWFFVKHYFEIKTARWLCSE